MNLDGDLDKEDPVEGWKRIFATYQNLRYEVTVTTCVNLRNHTLVMRLGDKIIHLGGLN